MKGRNRMGMSASQARLLSITARITNNEFNSQITTNAKLRLAEKSEEASEEYMDALDSQQLMFGVYNDNGEYTTQELTPAVLYEYSPLKNQYALINNAGKILVSNEDAKNYEETDNLYDFLARYTTVDQVTTTESQKELDAYNVAYASYLEDLNTYNNETYPAYLEDLNTYNNETYPAYLEDLEKYNQSNQGEYETQYQNYLDELKIYNEETYPAYLEEMEEYNKSYPEYEKQYQKYLEDLANLPTNDLYKMFTSVVGNVNEPQSCYQSALENGSACYVHVLTHLLGALGGNEVSDEIFETSTGNEVKLSQGDITGSAINGSGKSDYFVDICERMKDETLLCDGDDNYTAPYWNNGVVVKDEVKENLIQNAIDEGRTPTQYEILSSDYMYDSDTNTVAGLKTLKQKAIDLLYLLNNKMIETDDMYETIVNFTDGDMKGIADVVPPVPLVEPKEPQKPSEPEKVVKPTEPTPPTEPAKPVEPTKPKTEYKIIVEDKEKSQWYTNLWYYMNGSETANKVENYSDDGLLNTFTIAGASKDTSKSNYEVFEDTSLFKSSEWLQFALEHGMISMKQATYTDPSTDSYKVSTLTGDGYSWNSIIYTSATDITSQDDDVAIAIAEAKYKKTITEIESKDKQYDQDLKDLDTEHTALQTEYDSIKEVISKNVDRSFKAFS